MDLPKTIVAGIISKDNTFFIAQRSKQDENYGKWEFPGGKLEGKETDQECLQRELREELSIEAQVGNYVCSSYFEQNGIDYELKAYYVRSFSGTITLNEHQQCKWVTKEEFGSFEFPTPDLPIIEYLINKKPLTFLTTLQKQFFAVLRFGAYVGIFYFTSYLSSVYFEMRETLDFSFEIVPLIVFSFLSTVLLSTFINYYWQA